MTGFEIGSVYVPTIAVCPEHGRLEFPGEIAWYIHGASCVCDRGAWWIFLCPTCGRLVAGENAPLGIRLVKFEGHIYLEGAGCPARPQAIPDHRTRLIPNGLVHPMHPELEDRG